MTSDRTRRFFQAGTALGLGAALVSTLGMPRPDALGLGAAAVVDGRAIPMQALDRALAALAADKRNPVTETDRADALEHLIEEELLVQRGLALGLAETDLAARKAVVQSVLQLALSERAEHDPDEGALKAFFAENKALFATAGRWSVSVASLTASGSADPALTAARARFLAGATAASVGDDRGFSLPAGPLTKGELARYLGAGFADKVIRMQPGEVSAPQPIAGRYYLVRLDSAEAGDGADFEAVRDMVRREFDRRADEQAVRTYLDRLKRQARIQRMRDP